ncbi:MAG: long-chain fatty acid--CoA ligase [Acidobacteria bacterium]|nr:long-chain fatty acid--CoA ligase [Acidobacteriota bacterium]
MGSAEFNTLSGLFVAAVEQYSKPDAFLFKAAGKYQGLASAEAMRQVAALAQGLERLGLQRGDRVAILSENRLEWALTDYAALGLGAIDVPIYPTLLEPDIEYILRDSGAKGAVVSTETQLQKVLKVRRRLPELGFILSMDQVDFAGSGARHWHDIVKNELNRFADPVSTFRTKALEVRPEETATLLYTSGTTGEPKGVILTHANIVSNVQACRNIFAFVPEDIGFSFLPLSHVFERMLDYFYFSRGVSIAYPESPDAMPQNLLEVRPTVMAVVPRVLERIHERVMEAVRQAAAARQKMFHWTVKVCRRRLPYLLGKRTPPLALRLQHAVADRLICSKVRDRMGGRLRVMISGSAPLRPELAEFFHAMGLPVYEGYGLTETSPVISVNCPGRIKLGTVGPVIPSVEVKLGEEIVDTEGRAGREILVRGPNVTPGYYNRDADNRQAFHEGWFATGDLGAIDGEGFLSITGRKKNLFKTSGGKYVSPEKLEGLFQGHPYIAQIMVLGDGRRFISALIVPNFERLEALARDRGIAFTTRAELVANPEIQLFMSQQVEEATPWLAPHEKIRQVTLLPNEFTIGAGELTPTLKIRRRIVEERYQELIEAMYQRPAGASASATPR